MINLGSWIAAKIFVDKPKIPYKYYNFARPLINDIKWWAELFEEFEIEDPASWLHTSTTIVSNMAENPPVLSDPVREFLVKKGFVSSCPSAIEWAIDFLVEHCELFEEFSHGKRKVCRVDIKGGFKVYLVLTQEKDGENYENIEAYFPIKPDEANNIYIAIGDMFWEKVSAVILDENGEDFLVTRHEYPDKTYHGNREELIDCWRTYKEAKTRRVIILQGVPGTGKSTLCQDAAKELSVRTLVLTHNFLKRINVSDWKFIIKVLKPEVVIVDDIDRVPSRNLEANLAMFEDSFYDVPLTLLTTNDQGKLPDAFRRPGRVDQIISMPNPPPEIKMGVIVEFANDVGITDKIPEENMSNLLDAWEKTMSGAYVKELLIRYKTEGWDYKIPDYDMTFKEMEKKVASPSFAY